MARKELTRVAFFLHGLEAGGAQKRTVQLANRIAALGIAVDVLVVDARGPNRGELSPAVRVIELGSRWARLPFVRTRRRLRVFSVVPAVVRYLRRDGPDAWIAAANHTHFAALLAQRIARPSTSALVLRLSNSLLAGHRPRDRRLRTLAARAWYGWADAIAAVAPALRDELTSLIPSVADRAVVVVNPVIDERMAARALEAADPAWGPLAAPLIVAVGRLTPQKGFDTLLRAFSALCRKRPARLLILGEGPERPALERLASELGVGARVALPGFSRNPYPALRLADVVVSSSRWEGLPGVLIEALALGRPVVATDLPGSRAVLGEASPHPLVACGDAEGMARAIAAQLAEPPAAEGGRRQAEKFTVEAGARAMLEAIERARAHHDNQLAREARG